MRTWKGRKGRAALDDVALWAPHELTALLRGVDFRAIDRFFEIEDEGAADADR